MPSCSTIRFPTKKSIDLTTLVAIVIIAVFFTLLLLLVGGLLGRRLVLKKSSESMEMKKDALSDMNSFDFEKEEEAGSLLDFSTYKKEKCIGKGSFGTVFLCTLPPDFKTRKFALKHLISSKNEV
jgi:hypothetical protein